MKATGIVRRIDDLGRVIIPKEIRRSLRIRDGDPLEIYVEDGAIIYKKYHPISSLSSFVGKFANVLDSLSSHSVLITDRDSVVAVSGVSKREYIEQTISNELNTIIENRRPYTYTHDNVVRPTFDANCRPASLVLPIIASGDVYGSVVLLADDKIQVPSEVDVKLAKNTAAMIGSMLEE
jgi:AbrB family transcriptional regulator (stage V sporulation protein T)